MVSIRKPALGDTHELKATLTLLHVFQLVVELLLLTGQVGDIHGQSAIGLFQLWKWVTGQR